MFDDIIAKENATLKTDFEAINIDAKKFISAQNDFTQVRSQYENELIDLENQIKNYSTDNYSSPEEINIRNSFVTRDRKSVV